MKTSCVGATNDSLTPNLGVGSVSVVVSTHAQSSCREHPEVLFEEEDDFSEVLNRGTQSMTKRLFAMAATLVMFASLALPTPSHAGSILTEATLYLTNSGAKSTTSRSFTMCPLLLAASRCSRARLCPLPERLTRRTRSRSISCQFRHRLTNISITRSRPLAHRRTPHSLQHSAAATLATLPGSWCRMLSPNQAR